jgi:MoaA/NifB/PqqE/SkfB family radical SAM enzyme
MPTELFERIARECGSYDTRLWLHFLGEPLLHRRLTTLIAFAKAVGVREVGLSTNAVSLAGPRIDALLDSGLDRLECSMDAIDPAGYLAMRGRPHFERATANIRALLDRKRARRLLTPVTSIQFMRTPAVAAALRDITDAWRPFLGPRDFVMTIEPISFGGAIHLNGSRPLPAAGPRPPCRWLFESVMILQDGTVTMCGTDWDARAPLGNLRTASLTEIWMGPEAQRRRAAHLMGRFDAVGPCATCEDWRLADGHGYVNALEAVVDQGVERDAGPRGA